MIPLYIYKQDVQGEFFGLPLLQGGSDLRGPQPGHNILAVAVLPPRPALPPTHHQPRGPALPRVHHLPAEHGHRIGSDAPRLDDQPLRAADRRPITLGTTEPVPAEDTTDVRHDGLHVSDGQHLPHRHRIHEREAPLDLRQLLLHTHLRRTNLQHSRLHPPPATHPRFQHSQHVPQILCDLHARRTAVRQHLSGPAAGRQQGQLLRVDPHRNRHQHVPLDRPRRLPLPLRLHPRPPTPAPTPIDSQLATAVEQQQGGLIMLMANSKNKQIITILALWLCTVLVQGYVDVNLAVATSSGDVRLNMPVTINNLQYHIGISLSNSQDYIVAPNALPAAKKHKNTHPKALTAVMHVSSLEGYTLEGWKRFFMEVVLFESSKYTHTISFPLSTIIVNEKSQPMSNGIMSIGPKLQENQLYQLIKSQTHDYFQDDIVSFYNTPGGKDVRMQLGGFEDQNARGYNNGIRFYEKDITHTPDGKGWALPINRLVIGKERSNRWDSYNIPSSAMTAKITVESMFVILPETLKEDLQTSFESQNIECSFSATSGQLQCANISSIDEALTFVSFYLDTDVSLNISLYELRDQYNNKDKLTSFFVKLGSPSEVQIGYPLLKGYYISLNMSKPSLLFSPLNRFTPQISTAEIIRFVAVFMLFMLGACVCIVIWQHFSNPNKSRRFRRSKDGVRLVPYQHAAEFQQED